MPTARCCAHAHICYIVVKICTRHMGAMCVHTGIVRAAPFLEMTEKDFDDVLAVNLKGV